MNVASNVGQTSVRFPTDAGFGLPVLVASALGVGSYSLLTYVTQMQGRAWDLLMGSWVQEVENWLFLLVVAGVARKHLLIRAEARRVAYIRDNVLRALFSDRISPDDVPAA